MAAPAAPGTLLRAAAAHPPTERRELLCHRCLLRTPAAAAELAASPGWEADLFPYERRLPAGEA